MNVGLFILGLCALFATYPWWARLGDRLGTWASNRNQAHRDSHRALMREVRRQP
jgi:lauroyl/myristoyl acyltransferase